MNIGVSGSVLGRAPTMNVTTGAGIQSLDRQGVCARKLELDMKDRYGKLNLLDQVHFLV